MVETVPGAPSQTTCGLATALNRLPLGPRCGRSGCCTDAACRFGRDHEGLAESILPGRRKTIRSWDPARRCPGTVYASPSERSPTGEGHAGPFHQRAPQEILGTPLWCPHAPPAGATKALRPSATRSTLRDIKIRVLPLEQHESLPLQMFHHRLPGPITPCWTCRR